MKLQRRIDRLECATAAPASEPQFIIRTIFAPGASEPELVAFMHRPLHGGDVMQIDRDPSEPEAAFRARARQAQASLTVGECATPPGSSPRKTSL